MPPPPPPPQKKMKEKKKKKRVGEALTLTMKQQKEVEELSP